MDGTSPWLSLEGKIYSPPRLSASVLASSPSSARPPVSALSLGRGSRRRNQPPALPAAPVVPSPASTTCCYCCSRLEASSLLARGIATSLMLIVDVIYLLNILQYDDHMLIADSLMLIVDVLINGVDILIIDTDSCCYRPGPVE
jgi:hypothetical protein